jgi:hypothetical protein
MDIRRQPIGSHALIDEYRAESESDPEDMDDQLRERSENISAARDHAYDLGMDAYTPDTSDGVRDALAAKYFTHPKLQSDFCDGWDAAKQDDKS